MNSIICIFCSYLIFRFTKKFVQCVFSQWHTKAVWETGIPVWAPKLWCPKNTFQVFFFKLYFNKRYIEVAINDFTMYLVIWKWLRIQKCRQKWKAMRQRGQSQIINWQWKCFHSFNYVLDQASVCFFFYVSSLNCFV